MQNLMNSVRRAGTRLEVVRHIQEKRENGVTIKALMAEGYTIRDLCAAGLSAKSMLDEGVEWTRLEKAGLKWGDVSPDVAEQRKYGREI